MSTKVVQVSDLISWLKFKIENSLEKRFGWVAVFCISLLYVFGNLKIEDTIIWSLAWLFFNVLSNKLTEYNQQLKELNEKFAVNQRKLSKSIRDHNDFVSETMTEQKRFFESIVKPKKDNN